MVTTTQVLGGRYVLEEALGTGGMATVWRATDVVLGREVAVKVLNPQHAALSRTSAPPSCPAVSPPHGCGGGHRRFRHGQGPIQRPTEPSIASRSKSACPLCLAYSSTRCCHIHRTEMVLFRSVNVSSSFAPSSAASTARHSVW